MQSRQNDEFVPQDNTFWQWARVLLLDPPPMAGVLARATLTVYISNHRGQLFRNVDGSI